MKKPNKNKDKDAIRGWRIPMPLLVLLKKAAKSNRRTTGLEVIHRLEKSFQK